MKKKGSPTGKGASSKAALKAGGESAAAQSFEQALERLEKIVERLESGEETLDDSLRLHEEAMGLWRFCEERLRVAQGRIEELAGELEPPGDDEPGDPE